MKTAYFPLLGRFGNLLFIYAHARAWCEQNGYELCMDRWIGEKIFQIPEAKRNHNADVVFPERMYQHQKDLIYTRKQVREWFTFKPEILDRLRRIVQTAVLLNVRQHDDYRAAGLVTLSRQCYADACVRFGYDDKIAEYETDVNPTRMDDFPGDLSASGLGVTMAGLPSFYRLMTAPILFRANSTFSWWAATLGNGKVYSPIIKGLQGGVKDVYCPNFVEGNWPVMADCPENSDLHLRNE